MTPWNGVVLGRSMDRVIPSVYKVLMYMMLRPLPLSISTLVSHLEPTTGSTTRG
jgi:hypothetical protein